MLFRDMNNCTVICLQMLYRNQHFDYLTVQEQTETAKTEFDTMTSLNSLLRALSQEIFSIAYCAKHRTYAGYPEITILSCDIDVSFCLTN